MLAASREASGVPGMPASQGGAVGSLVGPPAPAPRLEETTCLAPSLMRPSGLIHAAPLMGSPLRHPAEGTGAALQA